MHAKGKKENGKCELLSQAESGRSRKQKKIGYGERKLTQIKEVKTLVWGLELDEGLRFEAEVAGYADKAFVFVTKCDDKLCVTIKERVYDKVIGKHVPGGKEQWKYFETPEAAWQYISKLLKPPFEVYYY
jgi:hypothetical protein